MKMKLKAMLTATVLAVIFLFAGILYAGNGDLTVQGNLTVLGTASGVGGLLNVQVLTSVGAGTYTPTPGTHKIIVELVGGGGGGGGATSTASNTAANGGGGASGAYARKFFAGISGTYAYSIGAGGSAGVGPTTNGGNGETTTFTGPGGVVVSAPGGGGGATGQAPLTSGSFANGADGSSAAIATNGDINTEGQVSPYIGNRIFLIGTSVMGSTGGSGASSIFPSSVKGGLRMLPVLPGVGNGSSASVYGGGGGGGATVGNAGNASGGTGKQGVIIIWEFS